MFASHSQVGRTRVNKVREGKRNPPKSRELNKDDHLEHIRPRSGISIPKRQYKVLGQLPKKSITGFDKLVQLQKDLFREGLTLGEYKNYIQEKVNDDKYYYKNLSEEDVSRLHQRYRLLIQKDKNRYNEIGDEKDMNRKQRKLYREKKRDIVNRQKRGMIQNLIREINKGRSIGTTHRCDFLSDNPDQWNHTKLLLFTGGRYMESHDKGWSEVYSKIVSLNTAHLFNLSSGDDFYRYIMDQ